MNQCRTHIFAGCGIGSHDRVGPSVHGDVTFVRRMLVPNDLRPQPMLFPAALSTLRDSNGNPTPHLSRVL